MKISFSHINSLLFSVIFMCATLSDSFVDLFFPFLNEIILLCFFFLVAFNFNKFKYDFGALLFIVPCVVFCILSVISSSNLHLGGYNTAVFIIIILSLFSITGISFNTNLLNKLLVFFSYGVLASSWYLMRIGYPELLGFEKASGIFINSNSFGMFIAFMIAFSVLSFKRSVFKWVYVFSLLPFLIFTNSRGSLLFILVFLILYLIKMSKSINRLSFYSLLGVGILLVGIMAFNVFLIDSDIKLVNKIQKSGSSGRFEIWSKIISNMLNDGTHLLFGSGPSTTFVDGKSAHNSYINESSNLGVFFVIFYVFLMIYKYIKFYISRYNDFLIIIIPVFLLGTVESILFINSLFWLMLLYINMKFKSVNLSFD